ncbi:MAG: adenosylhomocysteinase, partial [Bacteroidales bacterium]|nr:adenosylhomocysteinase [Bacteroidales bacterium]
MKNLIAANYREEEYPVCLAQAREWSVSRPLEGLTVLDVTPIYRNTLVKHLALLAAGAKLMVGRSALIPGDEKIVKLLEENGIKVISSDSPQSEDVDIILDC